MLKHLTFVAVAGLLLGTGCIITTNTTDSDSATEANNGTEGTGTEGTTSAGTEGTTDGGTDSATTTATEPTTTVPTTGEPTTTATTTATTDATTDDTGGSAFGNCGWNDAGKYYACDADGGVPGVEDPMGISPIACPDSLPAMDDKCDETSAVKYEGCCLPDGTLYFCSPENSIEIQMCGA